MSSDQQSSQEKDNSTKRRTNKTSDEHLLSYNSPKVSNPKKASLTIDIEEELARLGLETKDEYQDDHHHILTADPVGQSGNQHEVNNFNKNSKAINRHQRKHTDSSKQDENVQLDPSQSKANQRHESAMDKNKGQANGSLNHGGATRRGRHKVGTSSDITIPGTIVDTSALRLELLQAVEQNKVERVKRILEAGVDTNAVCDDKGRWPLHIAAFFGYTEIARLLLEHGAQKDQPDTALERTPLLYAAATSSDIVQLLLSYKVDIYAVNKYGATPLHYAAGSGQPECCKILASAGCDVNARDKQKMTPLHMAARVDDIWSIEVLLEFGADVHAKDSSGKTCLHHAAETLEGPMGQRSAEGKGSDHKKMGVTFKRLVAAGISINALDADGKTALYYAIQTGSAEACTVLQELGAEMMDGVSVIAMSRKFPSALIRPFLDKCISSNIETCDPESKHFYIQFDYNCLTFYPKDISDEKLQVLQHRDENESVLPEMGVLYALTWSKDSSILSHPVCESLLRLKWKKVKWFLYVDMLLYAIFLAFLTAVIFMEYESDEVELLDGINTTIHNQVGSHSRYPHGTMHNMTTYYCMDTTRNIVVWVILWFLTACLGVREMIQLLQAPLHYVVQIENVLELVLVFSVAMLSLAECGVKSFVETRDHFAAVCLIVGWTIQVTLYGKIPIFGVYIRMFAAVAVNILKCMFTYLGLLFAFSLTLHFLFRSQKEFDSVGFTFLKTFAMMVGEIELVRTFIENDGTYIVPVTSHLMFALFMIFISVILMCLLIALAVSDIMYMQRDGEYMQLVQQVKVASQLEDALQRRSLLFPQFGMRDVKSITQKKGVIFPNLKDHGKLGKDALELVISQHMRKMDASNANVISQQMHKTDDNEMLTKLVNQTARNTNEMADDLLQKLKNRMDMYTLEVERKNYKLFEDFRGDRDRGNSGIAREIVSIKNQLEELNANMREVSLLMKTLAERPSTRGSSSPVLQRHKRSTEPATTVTDFNATSTSSGSSPERSGEEDSPVHDAKKDSNHSSPVADMKQKQN